VHQVYFLLDQGLARPFTSTCFLGSRHVTLVNRFPLHAGWEVARGKPLACEESSDIQLENAPSECNEWPHNRVVSCCSTDVRTCEARLFPSKFGQSLAFIALACSIQSQEFSSRPQVREGSWRTFLVVLTVTHQHDVSHCVSLFCAWSQHSAAWHPDV
jgi:hypothetical protein